MSSSQVHSLAKRTDCDALVKAMCISTDFTDYILNYGIDLDSTRTTHNVIHSRLRQFSGRAASIDGLLSLGAIFP